MTVPRKGWVRRAPGWFGWAAFALLVLLVATFVYYRLRGPTAEQQAALALMRKDWRPAHGVNVFPLLFYLSYDVPQDRLNAQMAAEVAHMRQWLAATPFPAAVYSETNAAPLPKLSQDGRAGRAVPSQRRGLSGKSGLATRSSARGAGCPCLGMLCISRRAACICGLGRSAALQILAIAVLWLRFAPCSPSRSAAPACRSTYAEHP
jgi:hypothetical protein